MVRDHKLLKHDYLQCFEAADYSNMSNAVSVFAENHYPYSRNFIKYLQLVKDKVDETVRPLLAENIKEERGDYEEGDVADQHAHSHGMAVW